MSVTPLTIATLFVALVAGLLMRLPQEMESCRIARFGEDAGKSRLPTVARLLIYLVQAILAGLCVDYLGLPWALLFGSLFAAGGLFLMAVAIVSRSALTGVCLCHAALPFLVVPMVVLLPQAVFPSNPAASENLGWFFLGAAAILGAPAVRAILPRMGDRRTWGILACVALVPAVAGSLAHSEQAAGDPVSLTQFLSDPVLWCLALAAWMFESMENSLENWGDGYMQETGVPPSRARVWFALFWIVFLCSRLAAAYLLREEILHSGSDAWLIVGLALMSAMALGNMAGTRSRPSGLFGLLLVGLCFGPLLPSLAGVLQVHFANGMRGTATGIVLGFAWTGGPFLTPIMSRFAKRRSVHIAMLVPMVQAILLALVALFVGLALPLARRG